MDRLVGRMGGAIALTAILTGIAAGQTPQDTVHLQRVASAGRDVVHWTIDEGLGEQTIFLKNTGADRPVTIASWRVYECRNIRPRSCSTHKDGPTIKPGETVRLGVVRRQVEGEAYSFQYEFSAAYVEDAVRN
jgi:hypothetical protein